MMIREAQKSEVIHQHAAFLLRKKSIVSSGHNIYYDGYDRCGRKYSIHAEEKCIQDFIENNTIKKRGAMVMVIIRYSKINDSSLGLSIPCKKCEQCIEDFNKKFPQARIRRIYYSAEPLGGRGERAYTIPVR